VRGHLDKISNNMVMGAVNAFTGETGKGVNPISGAAAQPFAKTARELKAAGLQWVAVGDENYGEGSSREHAAMSPRYLNCAVVIVRSFARIAETNLKKQGILPLTFADPVDYDRVEQDDRVTISGLYGLEPGKPVTVLLKKKDGRVEQIRCHHTMTKEQIAWFRAGSALNAGQAPVDPNTGRAAELEDVKLRPSDVDVKPGGGR
jgi:aconitate hydratase